jgi:hypothetical protein
MGIVAIVVFVFKPFKSFFLFPIFSHKHASMAPPFFYSFLIIMNSKTRFIEKNKIFLLRDTYLSQ